MKMKTLKCSMFIIVMMVVSSLAIADDPHQQQSGSSVSNATNYAPVSVLANPVSTSVSSSSSWNQNTNLLNSASGVYNSGNSANWNSMHQGQNQTQGISDSGNSSSTSSVNSSQANSQTMNDSGNSAVTNNVQGSHQGQNQNSTANNAGNAQNVTMNTPKQHHNTPSMATFVPMPTSPCMVTFGGSGSGAGFGFGFAASLRNENCEKLELAKAFSSIGQFQASLEAMCSTEHAGNINACRAIIAERTAYVESKQQGSNDSTWFKSSNAGNAGNYQAATMQTTSTTVREVNMNHPNPWLN